MLCVNMDGRAVWGRIDACLCMAESLCCSPGTTTTLLIGYTQYKMLLVLKKVYLWLPVVRDDQLQKGTRKLCKAATVLCLDCGHYAAAHSY